jgi:hypothetical protein
MSRVQHGGRLGTPRSSSEPRVQLRFPTDCCVTWTIHPPWLSVDFISHEMNGYTLVPVVTFQPASSSKEVPLKAGMSVHLVTAMVPTPEQGWLHC